MVVGWPSIAAAQSAATDAKAGGRELPFFPSSQTTPDGKTVALTDYAQNAACIQCHETIGHQWQGSMHSAAMTDPVYLALYRMGSKETKGLIDNLCVGCHSSPMVVSGHGSADKDEMAELGLPVIEGVSCVVCHSITDSNLASPSDLPANASFVTDPKGPIIGSHDNRKCLGKAETVKSELLGKSEFCANCHGVVHPLNGFVIERTYEEWSGSIYAAKGIQCQDCHMQPVENAIQTGRTFEKPANPGLVSTSEGSPVRDHVYSHNFVGGNVVVTKLLGAEEHSRMAEKMLQNAASLELLMSERTSPGSVVQLRVKVNNETAGHNLPTSLVEVRQMWLDIQVVDADGNELFRTGAVDQSGDIDEDAVMFHAIAADVQGKPTLKPWEMTRFLYFHTVPPKGYTLERFAFLVPSGSKGPIKVTATLRYRSFPQSLANLLLGDDAPVVPIVDMTSAEKTIEISQ